MCTLISVVKCMSTSLKSTNVYCRKGFQAIRSAISLNETFVLFY